jgi:hypothetical protein
MTPAIVFSITALASVCVFAYAALEYLKVFRARNDVLDKFMAYQRAVEPRILGLEVTSGRFENLLVHHEELVARVGRIDEETKKAITDLASKWLGEVNSLKTGQAALAQEQRPHIPRFRP